MRIGYAKVGRAMPLPPSKWGEVGGDNEPPILLNKLARRNPQHEFVIVGRNSGERPEDVGLPSNVTNPWADGMREAGAAIAKHSQDIASADRLRYISDELHALTRDEFLKCDAMIVWIGQHGTSNTPIPKVGNAGELTKPQDSFVNYAGYVFQGVNVWRDVDPWNRREIYLCPDPRNYLKGRDLKWPPDMILSQYTWGKREKHYRYGDQTDPSTWNAEWAEPGVWQVTHAYDYAQLEVVGIPTSVECSYDWEGRQHFGIIINEARGYVKLNRLDAMRDWVMQLDPAWIFGKWSDEGQKSLGRLIQPLDWHLIWPQLRTVRCTFTTPSSGSHWATTKPWEAFACGTVCFFHPEYDKQDHVLKNAPDALKQWLRVKSPDELKKRVLALNSDRDAWTWLVTEQRKVFDQAMEDQRCIREIEARCLLTTS